MTDKKSGTREARVMGLLKEMEASIVKEESQACRLLHNIEEKLRNIVSEVDLKVLSDNKCETGKTSTPSTTKVWTQEGRDPKRPWTEMHRTRKRTLSRESRATDKKTSGGQSGDGSVVQSLRETSDTSLCTNSSKVQQLKLFWDKFFLTEMEPVKSRELIDKEEFISEAKCEVLEKPKRKSMRKGASRILEKTIPPSRVPISFRMVPSKQNRIRKRIEKDDNFSEIDILSREVSTYVAKIPKSSDESSETESNYTLAESTPELLPSPAEPMSVSDNLKEKLYKIFLAHQVAESTLSQELEEVKTEEDDKKGIYHHFETGRQISCSQKKGYISIMKFHRPLHGYVEYLAITREEVIFIDPSIIIKSKKPERKPRKVSTLLPCYYFTVEESPAAALAAMGDSFILDPKRRKHLNDYKTSHKGHIGSDSRIKTKVSYEKITFSSMSEVDNGRIKFVISKEEPAAKLCILIIFTFSSVTILGVIFIVLKFFQGSFLFC